MENAYLIVFAGLVAVGLLVQAAALLGIFLGVRRVQARLLPLIDSLHSEVLPAALEAGQTVRDLSPKLKTIAANLTEVSSELRITSNRVGDTVRDIMDRTRVQAAHVDGMMDAVLGQAEVIGNGIQRAMSGPYRRLNGLVNGVRAGVDVLRRKTPASHSESDADLFV